MEKIYKTEKEGQIDFFNNYGIPWQENNGVLVENCDGVYNGVLFEFKLNINGEREILDRQKVVRGSNVSVLTSHAGLNPRSCTALSLTASLVSLCEAWLRAGTTSYQKRRLLMGINKKSMIADWDKIKKIRDAIKDEEVEIDDTTDYELLEEIKKGSCTYTIRGGVQSLKKLEKNKEDI